MELRVGSGYDIHRLVKKRKFILGNVIIPYEKGFMAHSDGDVLIHAIIDSFLGACNLGDIGAIFPDNDPFYKDADSSILLTQTIRLINEKGFEINNIDTTIICQKPKLRNYISQIKIKLSEIINIDADKISIKAKTKEKMDAVGKGRAVEVFSTCLLLKK